MSALPPKADIRGHNRNVRFVALANRGHDTKALQAYLGHRNIQHIVRYAELSPTRFNHTRAFSGAECRIEKKCLVKNQSALPYNANRQHKVTSALAYPTLKTKRRANSPAFRPSLSPLSR
jgi:hypothetical protein